MYVYIPTATHTRTYLHRKMEEIVIAALELLRNHDELAKA
jgi:hypothetical protein